MSILFAAVCIATPVLRVKDESAPAGHCVEVSHTFGCGLGGAGGPGGLGAGGGGLGLVFTGYEG